MGNTHLTELIAPAFYKVHNAMKRHDYTHYWLKGGRGTTKSSFAGLEVVLLLLKNPTAHAVVLRKVANTLRGSVYNQILWAIEKLGASSKFVYRLSPMEIIYKPTGQKIMFFGCDNPMNIKSIKVPFGYTGIVWFEELDQFEGMEEMRNLNQSLLRGGDKFWEICSFNPPKSRDNWVNKESMFDESDRLVHSSNYLEVPREWLGSQFFIEAEKTKMKNELAYRNEYLGEVTGTGGSVFENVHDMRITEKMIKSFDHRHYGLDFGFAVDPLAYLDMHYDAKKEDLYIFGELYQQKLKNYTAAERIKTRARKEFEAISYYESYIKSWRIANPEKALPSKEDIFRVFMSLRRVGADSAEPKSIAEMRDYGLNIYGVEKGPDSVEYGMKWLSELNHIYIDKRRCPNAFMEFVSYEFEKNRNGEFISAYPDKNNHTIDAARYGMNLVRPLRAMRGNIY